MPGYIRLQNWLAYLLNSSTIAARPTSQITTSVELKSNFWNDVSAAAQFMANRTAEIARGLLHQPTYIDPCADENGRRPSLRCRPDPGHG